MPYFTTTELRALPDLDRFPDARLDEAHDWIVSIIERECDTAFIPTTVTGERLTGSGLDGLRLRNAYVTGRNGGDGRRRGLHQRLKLAPNWYVEDGYAVPPRPARSGRRQASATSPSPTPMATRPRRRRPT
jgi:hypothetical protein